MLSDEQLSSLMDKLNVPQHGRALVAHIRNSNPSRKVEGRAHNVACRYPSQKMGFTIQAESHTNELAAIYLWEHDDRTYEYYDQPPRIKLNYTKADGRRSGHLATPDFFLIQEDFIGWVECKLETYLIQKEQEQSPLFVRDESMTWQCPAGNKYASEYGLGFQLRSSAQNPALYVRNLKFLSDYWNAEFPSCYANELQTLKSKLALEKRVQLAELIRELGPNAVDCLYFAIAHDLAYVDLFNDVLSEPGNAYVYASREVADFFNAARPVRSEGTSVPPVKALQLTPGGTLTWATQTFSIKSVSSDHVFLQAPDGEVMPMRRSQLERLSKHGEIRGHDVIVDTTSILADLYRAASASDLADAVNRSKVLEAVRTCKAQEIKKVSARTIRHWKQRQREAALKFDDPLVGLISRVSARGNRCRKLEPRVIEIMREVITTEFVYADAKSLTVCWGSARNRCEAENLIPPSEKAFRREIKHCMSGHELTLAREGERAAYSQEPVYFHLDRSTPRHGERPFEIAHIDHTQLDLQVVGSKFGEVLAKPWLSIMLDAYSRSILAFVITFDSPSYRSCMLLIRECLRRHSRLPANIVVDRGAEFKSVYFEALLATFLINKKDRPPQKARFGSVIERFFGISNTQLIHNLRGNNKALQKPRQLSGTHDPRKRAVWTLAEFLPKFEEYVFSVYGELEHPTLGVSPNQAMAVGMARTGLRPMRLIPMTEEIEMLCLPSTKTGEAKIIPGKGIKIGYLYYRHTLMADPAHANKSVPVRYDPFNLAIGYAYVGGEWRRCESEYSALLDGITERQVMIIAAEIQGKNKRTHKRRAVNGQAISRYLRHMESTEALLLQQRKDAEQRQTYAAYENIGACSEAQGSWSIDAFDASWAEIDIEQMGEFK